MPHAQAKALFNKQGGDGKKPMSATREEEFRKLHQRFENCVNFHRGRDCRDRIVLPLPPAQNNGYLSRAHFTVKGEFAAAYRDQCDALYMAGFLPQPGKTPPDFVRCEIQVYSARAMDRDGASARCKWPQDWLKFRGYIKDDADKYFEAIFLPPIVVPQKEVRVEYKFLPDQGAE